MLKKYVELSQILRAAGPFHTDRENEKGEFFWCCNYAKMLSFMMKLLNNTFNFYSSAQKYEELSRNMEWQNILH